MEWLLYLLKVSACTGLFYVLYYGFFKHLTFFSVNRFYLLITLLLSFIIPAAELQVERTRPVAQVQMMHSEVLFDDETTVPEVAKETSLKTHATMPVSLPVYEWKHLFFWGYVMVAVIAVLIFLVQLGYLLTCIRKVYRRVGNIKVIHKPEGFTNCSFFNYVFISDRNLTDQKIAVLLQHESLHALKYHSIDKLFLGGCKALLWFNPFIYLYDKALEAVHEYDVDRETSSIIGNKFYANLLLEMAVNKNNGASLVHSFVKNPVKERIKILFTNPSNNMKKIFYLLSLPVCLILFWVFSVQVVYAEIKQDVSDLKVRTVNPSGKFIEIVKGQAAGPSGVEEVDVVVVKSPRGKVLKMVLSNDYEIKFVVNGVVYTFEQALNFDKTFISTLSENRAVGSGRYYSIPGVKKNDRIFWFGKEPALSDETLKTRIAIKKYEGKTVFGKVSGYTYTSDGKRMSGFTIKRESGDVLKAYVNPLFAVQVNKQLKIGDDIKINAFNAFFSSECNCEVIGSGTYVKNGKVIFDRDRFVVDDRGEGVKTNYRTLAKIEYQASDSVKYSKDRKIVDLYGSAKLNLDSLTLEADHVRINNYTKIVTAFNGKMTSRYSSWKLNADTIRYDLKTKQIQSRNN
ncbi:M56 family metallopeptidase [Pedobacter nyackensis]|uniref:M56 family metallopeptidase n=1 Tax=Pedobacter nyackensis TaxID=475255 RepID=UPI00292D3D47|nr:M56 family metallopeptidase [Pedobacter nyackensis]